MFDKKMEELNFTSEEINYQVCTTTKMKRKKKLVKKQRVKKNDKAKSDLIVIEHDPPKQKQKKIKYQIEKDEDDDLTLNDLKKTSA